jgi:hypothetical protein
VPYAPAAPRRRLRPVLITAAVIVAAVGAAWVLQWRLTGGTGESQGSPAPPVYSIKVEQDGRVLRTYDLSALHALPQSKLIIDGKEQDGPSLAVLLTDAGAASFDSVDVRGAGLRDSGRLQLTAAQVSQHVQLDFTERGTVKVCGPNLTRPQWVRDVLSIDVR